MKFDFKFKYGHTCDGLCEDGYGRWLNKSKIKLVEENKPKVSVNYPNCVICGKPYSLHHINEAGDLLCGEEHKSQYLSKYPSHNDLCDNCDKRYGKHYGFKCNGFVNNSPTFKLKIDEPKSNTNSLWDSERSSPFIFNHDHPKIFAFSTPTSDSLYYKLWSDFSNHKEESKPTLAGNITLPKKKKRIYLRTDN